MSILSLDKSITIAREWDALLASRGCDPSLKVELEALPESPLKAVRLSQAYLVTGQSDFALQTLPRDGCDPLVKATRLAIHAARYEYAPILTQVNFEAVAPTGNEARARSLYTLAFALWGEYRLQEAMCVANAAKLEAKACEMSHFALSCERLYDDCEALRLEINPTVREHNLRRLLDLNTEEEQIETRINLMQLMYRQGRYDESMRLSQLVPIGRQGRVFQSMSLIANLCGNQVKWNSLPNGLDYGRLHAMNGLLKLDASFILAGPEPRIRAPLTTRHVAEWHLAFGWATMRQGNFERAASYLEVPFIPRTEWDLRLIRATIWLEMLVAAPEFAFERCNAPAMLEDALRLLRDFIAPNSILVRSMPRAAPLAVALLTASPGGCAALEGLAGSELVVLNARGITVNGLTRTQADSQVRVANGDELESSGLTAQAIRSARYRLKRVLHLQAQPCIVKATNVLYALERIMVHSPEEHHDIWLETVERYRHTHALQSSRSLMRSSPI